MTKQELKQMILSRMSLDQAFDQMLDAHIREYEHLKFSSGNKIHPLQVMAMAILDMGWEMIVEGEQKSNGVRGMITGTPEYMDEMMRYLPQKASKN